jgi:hypothetical protein
MQEEGSKRKGARGRKQEEEYKRDEASGSKYEDRTM